MVKEIKNIPGLGSLALAGSILILFNNENSFYITISITFILIDIALFVILKHSENINKKKR